MPKLAWLTVLAALGVLGVPLMATFISNEMAFFGAFKTQPVGAFGVALGLALTAIAVAVILQRVLFGQPNPDAPAVSDTSLSETWYLAVLAGGLLWVGILPGGPKIPGTDFPLFDPGMLNVMVADIPEISAPYTGPSCPRRSSSPALSSCCSTRACSRHSTGACARGSRGSRPRSWSRRWPSSCGPGAGPPRSSGAASCRTGSGCS
jgi:hypothetical protein